jgi:hypothetical protein
MKRLLVPFIILMLILMAAGAAGANGGVGFRFFIGLPLFSVTAIHQVTTAIRHHTATMH